MEYRVLGNSGTVVFHCALRTLTFGAEGYEAASHPFSTAVWRPKATSPTPLTFTRPPHSMPAADRCGGPLVSGGRTQPAGRGSGNPSSAFSTSSDRAGWIQYWFLATSWALWPKCMA